jgi:hypothetical protein
MKLRKYTIAILLVMLVSACIKEINITYIISTVDTNLLKKIPHNQIPKDTINRTLKLNP